jgi:hypothetical protein
VKEGVWDWAGELTKVGFFTPFFAQRVVFQISKLYLFVTIIPDFLTGSLVVLQSDYFPGLSAFLAPVYPPV